MSRFRHDTKHLTSQQQAIIRQRDERDRIARQASEKASRESKKEYKGYTITVNSINGIYEAIGAKGEYRENSHGDTKEDAIRHLKQKIDNITAYKEIYKELDK